MIDLNLNSRKPKQDETPTGIVILGLMPFAVLFWWGIIHAL